MKLLSLFLLSTLAWQAGAATAIENCPIRIRTQQRNGQKHQMTFGTKLNSKNECQRLAKMHTKNFDPQMIAYKNVSYRWRGYK